jgi:hypothetical protein
MGVLKQRLAVLQIRNFAAEGSSPGLVLKEVEEQYRIGSFYSLFMLSDSFIYLL